MEKAVVILSGGQDSTTCLLKAIHQYGKENVSAISYTYHHKFRKDIECAKRICQQLKIHHEIYDIGVIQDLSQTNNFEGRNLLLISLAVIYAKANQIQHVIVGLAGNSIHADCKEEFLEQLKKTIKIGIDDQIHIEAPLINKEKKDIWKLADELGYLNFIKDNTFSCWTRQDQPCGICQSCQVRQSGLEEYLKSKEGKHSGEPN